MSELLRVTDRMYVPIEQIAIPSDISIFGGHFGQHSYYADFAGLAKRWQATAILEIGVRFGYSAIAMCHGAMSAGCERPRYDGFDACFFSDPAGRLSHALALENLLAHAPGAEVRLWHCDTRNGWPVGFEPAAAGYDLINVDGDHSYSGCYNDMARTWPLLRAGGVMVVDDVGMTEVRQAILQFHDERSYVDEVAAFQWYHNERGFGLFRKGPSLEGS